MKNEINKINLNKAFRELRKNGYFARQNFWCCQTCAWADIPNEKSKNVVFYHNQDNQDLKQNGECFLSWNGDGKLITKILKNNNIKVDWNGNKSQRIKIYL